MAKTKLGELEQLWRKISGALKSTIDAHGPITELLITSTTKRIVGSINAPEEQAEIMHELAEIDELRHALDARDERIRELEQQLTDYKQGIVPRTAARHSRPLSDFIGAAPGLVGGKDEDDFLAGLRDDDDLEQQLKAAQERLAEAEAAILENWCEEYGAGMDAHAYCVYCRNDAPTREQIQHMEPGCIYAEMKKEDFAKHSPSSGKERG